MEKYRVEIKKYGDGGVAYMPQARNEESEDWWNLTRFSYLTMEQAINHIAKCKQEQAALTIVEKSYVYL